MNYDMKCSKCPPFADTHACIACGSQWLCLVTQTKLTEVHFKTRELVLAFIVCEDSSMPQPDNPVD